jgi:hypothetical protein
MDFAAWIEVYLGGRWHAFDPGAPGLSLQIEELQGDFDRMQGGPKLGPAKSDQISIVWTASPYSRSREDIIFSREGGVDAFPARSRLYAHRYDRAALQRLLTESLAGRAQPGDGEKAGTTEATNVRHRQGSGRTRAARPLSS